MNLRIFLLGLAALLSFSGQAQNEHFEWLGLDVMPVPTDSIDALPYSGDANDFSGGYALGDTVADFHLWTLNGEEYILSNEVEADKPTILFNGSVTCIRFQNDWNPALTPIAYEWVYSHLDDFNWVPIYTAEAHALDVENCPSNCPDLPIAGPHGQYLLQHRTYQDRLDAAQIVMDYMTPEADNGWQWPFDDLLIDAPNNLMYEHYFMRPAGIVVINCDGVVVARGDWFGSWLNNGENQTILENLIDGPQPTSPECLLVADTEEPCDSDFTDSDGDGVCDTAELLLGTDPFNPCDLGVEGIEDTDGDGNCDALETLTGTDPLNPCDPVGIDTDGDGFCDIEEELMGANPFNPCSPSNSDADDDGYCDAEELSMGSDPEDPCSPDGLDSDMDGLCNSMETANGSDPNDICDPNGADVDGDGLCDQLEILIGSSASDPCDPYGNDSDGDGFCDTEELLEGWGVDNPCSPNDTDVDGDGWCGGMETANGWNDLDPCAPIGTDSDGDGLCDMEELLFGSDAHDPCSPQGLDTDGDGWCDVYELLNGTSPTEVEGVLNVEGTESDALDIRWTADGFRVLCEHCLGQRWVVLDLGGRQVAEGRLASDNVLTAPEGLYLLHLPESGHQEVLRVSAGY